jgi:hypothetical protein
MKNVEINATRISETTNPTGKSPPGAIVGGAIGGAAFLLVIVAVILFLRRRKARRNIVDPYDGAYPLRHPRSYHYTPVSQNISALHFLELNL